MPFESIKADLIDAVVLELVEDDKRYRMNKGPKYWAVVIDEARKSQHFGDICRSAYEQIENLGVESSLSGIILKAVLVGWRLAEAYLQKEAAKGVQ